MRSLEGQLLVAPKNLTDPAIAHAVVLVVRHNGHEASGVLMNRPVDEPVLVFGGEENKPLSIANGRPYIGGPLMGPLMALHTDQSLAEAEILPKLFFTASEQKVFALLQQSEHPYKIFAGHMGWGPEELERELDKTAWRTTPCDDGLRLFAQRGVVGRRFLAYSRDIDAGNVPHPSRAKGSAH